MFINDTWNPEQYKRFQSERSRPFWDLVKMVNFENIYSLLDVGCGTGQLTQALHLAHQIPRTLAIDSSPKMLEPSASFTARGLTYECVAVEDFMPADRFDLVLSNAALQWIDDQVGIFSRLSSWLKPGGTLAVQMPMNFEHPSHRIAGEVAHHFGLKPRQNLLLRPEGYARLLWDVGLTQIEVSLKVYLHPMPSVLEVVEWTKGSLLTFYQSQLTAPRFAEFLKEYTHELLKDTGEGSYLYTFKRLFLTAKRE